MLLVSASIKARLMSGLRKNKKKKKLVVTCLTMCVFTFFNMQSNYLPNICSNMHVCNLNWTL